jgi:hypothetical protein
MRATQVRPTGTERTFREDEIIDSGTAGLSQLAEVLRSEVHRFVSTARHA